MEPVQLLLPGADLAGAIAQAPPGAALMLAPGEFRFAGPLVSRADLTVVGAGAGATSLVGETRGAALWSHVGPGRLLLRGLALRQHVGGPAAWSQDGRADLVVASDGSLEVVDCAFLALAAGVEPLDDEEDTGWYMKRGGTAIVLRRSAEARISGCAFARAPQAPVQDTQGVEVEGRARATVVGCRFEGLYLGVEVALGASLDLADSAFSGCESGATCSWWEDAYDARDVRPDAPRRVVGCTFVRNGLGLLVGGPQRTRVEGCTFEGNQRPLIVREDGADLAGNTFTNNVEGIADPFGRLRYVD